MASVFKIPVMVEAFRQQGEGRFSLDDRWELHDEDKATGGGVLTRLAPGLRLTVRDLVTLMIIISDNTATDMLVRRLGTERITATMRALGLRQAELLARIHTGEGLEAIGVGAAARAEQRRILLLQQLNDRLPAFLPQGVPVAHKTGTLPGPWAVRNDAGLLDVGDGGVVAVAVFTRTAVPAALNDEARARLLRSIDEEIAALGRAVYQHYAGTG